MTVPPADVMPTPMRWYGEAAARWGKVDPEDKEAVKRFFVHTFHTLSEKTRQEIVGYLLDHDGPQEGSNPRKKKGKR